MKLICWEFDNQDLIFFNFGTTACFKMAVPMHQTVKGKAKIDLLEGRSGIRNLSHYIRVNTAFSAHGWNSIFPVD